MANYLDLDELKRHLNLDENFDADDLYLMGLRDAAEEVVAKYIDYPLTQLEDENHKLPASINHAMLLLIASWYCLRESVSSSNMLPVNHSFELLCDIWRDYKIDKSE